MRTQPNGRSIRPPHVRTGLLAAGLFVVLGAVAACQSGTSGAAAGASLDVAPSTPSITGSAPVPPTGTSPPVAGAPTSAPPAGGAPASIHPPTALPVPSQPRIPVPPGEVDSRGMVNPPVNVQVTQDGRYVVFGAEQAGCQVITAQATAQTATQVTIVVNTRSTHTGTQMCPMIVRQVYVTVQLSAPLNGRTIVFQGVNGHG